LSLDSLRGEGYEAQRRNEDDAGQGRIESRRVNVGRGDEDARCTSVVGSIGAHERTSVSKDMIRVRIASTYRMYRTLLHRMKTSPSVPFDRPFSISSVFANYEHNKFSASIQTKRLGQAPSRPRSPDGSGRMSQPRSPHRLRAYLQVHVPIRRDEVALVLETPL
jgi:hypothetical protein